MNIPTLTTEQMREVDRLMIEEYGIQLLQMMENAGRGLAELARDRLGGALANQEILVFCGKGNNGGGGLVAARYLHNWGASVQVRLAEEEAQLKTAARQHWETAKKLRLQGRERGQDKPDLVIDALLGYGAVGDPRPPVSDCIQEINQLDAPVLALDSPSGLDTTSGQAGQPCVTADWTLTLALPKVGLLRPGALPFVGELFLADIGVPPEVYAEMTLGLAVGDLFAQQMVVKIGD
jgi:NAD(P)H-hydrate epimerase